MHAFIRERRVARETHVWHSGMDSWKAAAEVEDLSTAFAALPPPLTSPSEAAVVSLENERTADASILAASTLARPWPRFWARFIDISLFVFLSSLAIGIATVYFAPQFYLKLVSLDSRVFGIMLLPLVAVLLALSMAATGTTPGKAILGIRVKRPADRMNLTFYLGREFRVWLAGLGLGIPIVALFTQIRQYRLVAAGKPASYDESGTTVEGQPILFRVFVGAFVALALFSTGVYFEVMDKQNSTDLYATRQWINPINSRLAEIAETWTTKELKTNGGRAFYFASPTQLAEAVFGYEQFEVDGVDNLAYANAIKTAVSSDIELTSEWSPVIVRGHPSLRATGKSSAQADVQVEVTVTVIGRNAWRALMFARGRPAAELPGKDKFVDAIFGTAD